MTQPASGYQLARTLFQSGAVAQALSQGPDDAIKRVELARRALWPWTERTKWKLFDHGAAVLSRMGERELASFFDVFHREHERDVVRYIDGRLGLAGAIGLMLRTFKKASRTMRRRLLLIEPPRSSGFLDLRKEAS
jgi:hypothetical protein